ncbi:hypothetical protein [Paracidovorax valerianellae]|nr:hypothetical protein [Paracidovorax valerianellae]MDA8444995.1 hypothetical protein [Paracidovorax valerianellae]
MISHFQCAGPANGGRTKETLPFIDPLAERQPVAMRLSLRGRGQRLERRS